MKIMIIGDGGVGKTTYIHRHLTGEFRKKYVSTFGIETYSLTFETNVGSFTFTVGDCAGHEKFCTDDVFRERLSDSEAVIVMFDTTNRLSFRNAKKWINLIRTVLGSDIRIVLCGNKIDCVDRKITSDMIDQKTLKYYDISVKSNYNLEKPFLYLIRKQLNDKTVKIVA